MKQGIRWAQSVPGVWVIKGKKRIWMGRPEDVVGVWILTEAEVDAAMKAHAAAIRQCLRPTAKPIPESVALAKIAKASTCHKERKRKRKLTCRRFTR